MAEPCPHCSQIFRNSSGLYNHIVKHHNRVVDDETVLVPASPCPGCGELCDAATNFEFKRPSPGDWSICAYCGHARIFSSDLSLREMTPAERIELGQDEKLLHMQRVVRSTD